MPPLSFAGSGFWGKQFGMPLVAPPLTAEIRILADGRDGIEGRGLLLISALHLAAHNLRGVETRVRASAPGRLRPRDRLESP